MPNQWDIFSLFLVHDACLRSYFKNSRFVFHRGFQTRENWWKHEDYSLVLLLFSSETQRWNTRTRFWNITSNISSKLDILKNLTNRRNKIKLTWQNKLLIKSSLSLNNKRLVNGEIYFRTRGLATRPTSQISFAKITLDVSYELIGAPFMNICIVCP